jgi:hypothetical protein
MDCGKKNCLADVCDPNHLIGINMVRGKCAHQLPTANGKLLLVEGIEALPPLLPHQHEIRFFELFQVVADGWLVYFAAKLIHDLVHTEPDATKVRHDLLTGLVGKRFSEGDWISIHAPIISIIVNMSRGILAYRERTPAVTSTLAFFYHQIRIC